MQTIVGTIVYFNDNPYDLNAKSPFLYVSKNEKYKLQYSDSLIYFDKYDNLKVEITGQLNTAFDIIDVETICTIN